MKNFANSQRRVPIISNFKFQIIFLLVILFFTSACGNPNQFNFEPLSKRLPHVVGVLPSDGETVNKDAVIAVEFSQKINGETVSSKSLAVVKCEDDAANEDKIVEQVVKGDKSGIEGEYEVSDEGQRVTFRNNMPYDPGATYLVVATNKLAGEGRLPFNQGTELYQGAFASKFIVLSEENNDSGGSGQTSSENQTQNSVTGSTSTPSSGVSIKRPAKLAINELLYDVVGDDTDGKIFIELAGDPETDIGGYKILFVNGDDGKVSDAIELPASSLLDGEGIFLIADAKKGQTGASFVEGQDLIDNFDPQNGPDCVQLFDNSGKLIDALGYGEPIVSKAENGLACFEGTSAPKVASGKSLSRTNGEDTENNLADFKVLDIPTPGEM